LIADARATGRLRYTSAFRAVQGGGEGVGSDDRREHPSEAVGDAQAKQAVAEKSLQETKSQLDTLQKVSYTQKKFHSCFKLSF
jgi:hypothetical protein